MKAHKEKSQNTSRQSAANSVAQKQTKESTAFQLEDNRLESKIAIQLFGNTGSNIQSKKNQTGLPNNLKTGIENLSGHAMDDVKVHYNSSKPAQLNAYAYAQGTNIHIASGQEKHLPHEAWHVVQQKQGRVKPTTQLQKGTYINNDDKLESEATVMGEKAMQLHSKQKRNTVKENSSNTNIFQLVHERLTKVAGNYTSIGHIAELPNKPGIMIELLIPYAGGGINKAKAKIDQIADQANSPLNTAIAIGLNGKVTDANIITHLQDGAAEIIEYATAKHIACTVVPMTWAMPTGGGGGYVFPFLEARNELGQDANAQHLKAFIESAHNEGTVFHRIMDVDVSDDPLLGPKKEADESVAGKTARLQERNQRHQQILAILSHKETLGKIITGGYNWKETPDVGPADPTLAKVVKLVNYMEHWLRIEINHIVPEALYAPEPNTYIPSYYKDLWDGGLKSGLTDKASHDVQMGESTFGRKALQKPDNAGMVELVHAASIATVKPQKHWLNNFQDIVTAIKSGELDEVRAKFNDFTKDIHQSYMNLNTSIKIAERHGVNLNASQRKKIEASIEETKEMLWNSLTSNFDLH